MKKLLILTLLLSSFAAQSKTVARVLGVEGNAFNFMSSKKAKQLIYGSKIEDASVVMVEDGATISIKDEAGRIYHLSGGAQVKIFNRLLEVQKGFVWVDSRLSSIGTVSSGNSVVKYTQGQFIFSFDNYKSKSQVMVLTGNVQLSNSVEPELLVEVPAGHFSFVDNEIREGMPRGATRVGMSSYKSFQKLFAGNERIKHKTFDKAFKSPSYVPTQRAIASVAAPKGKVLYFGATKSVARIPASAEPSAMNYYQEVTTYKPKKKVIPKVKMRFFGMEDHSIEKKSVKITKSNKRTIASIDVIKKPEKKSFFNRKASRRLARLHKKEVDNLAEKRQVLLKKQAQLRKPASINGYQKGASAFEKSLRENERKNMRHSDERNSLIDELKSYNRNYQKQY